MNVEMTSMQRAASYSDDMGWVKQCVKGQLPLLGNINSTEACRWSVTDTKRAVMEIIRKAEIGGGLIIWDSAGEMPLHIQDEVLIAISDTVLKWGRYPLDWMEDYGKIEIDGLRNLSNGNECSNERARH